MRQLAGLAPLLLAAALGYGPAEPAGAQRGTLWVNSTDYVFPVQTHHCVASTSPCPFNAAVDLAQRSGGGGLVTACFDAGDPRCLQEDDPNYDAATRQWHLQVSSPFSAFIIDQDHLRVDFTANVPGWSSPADNRIVLEFKTDQRPTEGFIISGNENQLAGFRIIGNFQVAAVVVRADGGGLVADKNTMGPGLIFAGQAQGVGLRLRGSGVQENRVVGSWCGVIGDGRQIAPMNEFCIELQDGANRNIIGGPEERDRNVLSGSEAAAIQLRDAATRDNIIQNNYIGTDVTGVAAAPNNTGITVVEEAAGTRILDNVLSGNRVNAILADNTSTLFGRIITRVENNYIGVDRTGQRPLSNGTCGIEARNLSKNMIIKGNRVWFNRLCGISVSGTGARTNTITENSVTQNAGRGIDVLGGANDGIRPPVVVVAERNHASGTACPNCVVEVFSDTLSEAMEYEGTVQAGPDGAWEISKPEGFRLRVLTATATDGENTSGLSQPKVIPGTQPTPSPTPDEVVPTPTRRPPVLGHKVRLPTAANRFARR